MKSDLQANYSGVYETRLGFGKRPALILVDFVQAYFDPACDLYADVDVALASAIRVRGARTRRQRAGDLHQRRLPEARAERRPLFQKAKPLRHFLEGSPMGAWPVGLDVATMNSSSRSNIRAPSSARRWRRR